MFRVIKEVKPRWIIGENVQNLTNISNGEILQGIYNDLESQGYEVQTFNISASSQGAWHKRARVWIVAANAKCKLLHGCSSTTTDSTKKFTRLECNKSKVRGEIWSKIKRCSEQNLQHTNNKRFQKFKFSEKPKKKNIHNRQFNERASNKSWWETQSELCGVPNGVQYELHPDRANRIKALGNSIVPQIVTEIGQAIIKAEEEIE